MPPPSHVPDRCPTVSNTPELHSLTPTLDSAVVLSSQTLESLHLSGPTDGFLLDANRLPNIKRKPHFSDAVLDSAASLNEHSSSSDNKLSKSQPQETLCEEHNDDLEALSPSNSMYDAETEFPVKGLKAEHRLATQSLYEESTYHDPYHDPCPEDDKTAVPASEAPSLTSGNASTPASTPRPSQSQTPYNVRSSSYASVAVSHLARACDCILSLIIRLVEARHHISNECFRAHTMPACRDT
jgi:hypothetical protein